MPVLKIKKDGKWVEISGGGGSSVSDWNQIDESAPDYIKNKPFGETPTGGDTLIWDGNTDEKTSVAFNQYYYYHVSDLTPTIDDIGTNYTIYMNGGDSLIGTQAFTELADGVIADQFGGYVFIVSEHGVNVEVNGVVFPKKGIYFLYLGENAYFNGFKIPGYTNFPKVMKLDVKFLPDKEFAGKKVAEEIYTIDDTQVIAGTGAEIFNNYYNNKAVGIYSHAEGDGTKAIGDYSHAEGDGTDAIGEGSHAEGRFTAASGDGAHAEGFGTTASGDSSHAEGFMTTAFGDYSHAEGRCYEQTTKVTGEASALTYTIPADTIDVFKGLIIRYNDIYALITDYNPSTYTITLNTTLSDTALSEEYAYFIKGIAFGDNSHAEGNETTASGDNSHAEGHHTIASGEYSHAEGFATKAFGDDSHTEGILTVAEGRCSHAEGYYAIANGNYQHVQGKYNIEDASSTYAHIVGNGTAEDARSNAHTIDWNGDAWFQGDVYVGSTSGTNKDEGSKKLVTEEEVVKVTAQTLTDDQKAQARANIGAGTSPIKGVDYWTEEDKAEIREYINQTIYATIDQAIAASY